ncbi:MAG: pilus assembly PilX N-terminal domain-containing protein [Planctomycetota bacterium]
MKQRNAQSGVIFIAALILLAGMSVVIVALANEVSLDLKMATALIDADQALETAKVGIDKIIYAVNNDANWRTTYTSGTKYGPFPLGDGTFYVTIIDDDGNLADSPIDSVTVRSVATYKGTTRTVSATLTPPVHQAMMYLAAMWDSGRKIETENGPRVYGDLMSNGNVSVIGALPDLRGDIYCRDPNKVDGRLIDADTAAITISPTPTNPNPNIDWFIARGQPMSPPIVNDKYEIADKVISPTSNPYGFASANGIYYIQGGKQTRFVRCHITATIVVKTGKEVWFDEASVHSPASPENPALLSDQKIYYNFDRNLSEPQSGVDFNGDGDKTDVFTPFVSGLIHAADKFHGLQYSGGTNTVRFKGTIIAKEMILIGRDCIFEQDPALSTNLVEQFQGTGMKLVKGSVKIE